MGFKKVEGEPNIYRNVENGILVFQVRAEWFLGLGCAPLRKRFSTLPEARKFRNLARVKKDEGPEAYMEWLDAIRGKGFGEWTFGRFTEYWWEEHVLVGIKDKRGYRIRLDRILETVGNVPLESVGPAQATAHIRSRTDQGIKITTIANEITLLKTLLNFAVSRDILKVNRLLDFKMPRALKKAQKERPYCPKVEQMEAFLGAARDVSLFLESVCIIFAETGIRRAEGFPCARSKSPGLMWSNVDLAAKEMWIRGKSIDERKIVLTERAIEAFRRLPRNIDPRTGRDYFPNVFLKSSGFPYQSPPNKLLKNAITLSGLPFKAWHTFRHFAITDWLNRRRYNLKGVQKMAGHSDLAITAAYVHDDYEITREQVFEFERKLALVVDKSVTFPSPTIQ